MRTQMDKIKLKKLKLEQYRTEIQLKFSNSIKTQIQKQILRKQKLTESASSADWPTFSLEPAFFGRKTVSASSTTFNFGKWVSCGRLLQTEHAYTTWMGRGWKHSGPEGEKAQWNKRQPKRIAKPKQLKLLTMSLQPCKTHLWKEHLSWQN